MSMTSSIYHYTDDNNKCVLSYWQNNYALREFMCKRVAKCEPQDIDEVFITIDDLYSAHIHLCNMANLENLDYMKSDVDVTTLDIDEIKCAIQFAIENPTIELFYECGG